jgi:hypothetical protein
MTWLSDHFWLLLGGVGGAAFVTVLVLFQRLFSNRKDDTDAMKAAIRDSLTGSPSSGSQVTQQKESTTKRAV